MIDARSFTGVQACNSNPFAGFNLSVRLLLGNVFIVTSVPWWTPQADHSIEGVATGTYSSTLPSLSAMGTTIAACGAGLNHTVIWGGSSCLGGAVNVFPNGPTGVPATLPAFTVPHGPFQNLTANANACLLCGGGENGTLPEGSGWNSNGAGEQISNVTLDLGGGNGAGTGPAVFGYYSLSSQERTTFSNMKWADYSPQGGAGYFFDRTEAPTGTGAPGAPNPAGATRPVLRDQSLVGAGPTCPNLLCYGIVQEGANITIAFGSTSSTTAACNPYPILWVTGVNSSGMITGVAIGYGGNCPLSTRSLLTCNIYGASASYPWNTTGNLDPFAPCLSLLTFSGSGISSIALPISSASGFPPFPLGFSSGGMILENVNMFASPGLIQDGLWMDGVVNPLIGHLHCQGMSTTAPLGYCEHIGAGNPVTGGTFLTHDTLDIAGGLADLGLAVDGSQTFVSMRATASGQDIIFDEKNNVHLTALAYNGEVGQYLPGSFLTAANQGTTFYGHVNNASPNSANAGTCTMSASTACTVISFSPPWNNAPACTATWAGGTTLIGKIKAVATTSALTITSTATETITVAYHCEGNPN
ncbi:MAG: hypothetical protein ACLPOO_15065 [Terriglobales bacterium]